MAAVAPSEERVEIEALYRKHDPAKLVEVDDPEGFFALASGGS